MVGIRFSALSTVEDWSLADRPLGRINDHSGARQWLHLRRKLKQRSPETLRGLRKADGPDVHPLFRVKTGAVEDWEREI